jgi:hypothetical protein
LFAPVTGTNDDANGRMVHIVYTVNDLILSAIL